MWLVLILWLVFCPIYCGTVASNKGRSVGLWVLAGICIGPFALIWVLLLPSVQPAGGAAQGGLMKLCPFCGEPIRRKAILCRHCGRRLYGDISS